MAGVARYLIMASVIFESPIRGIDRGWEAHRLCCQYVKDNAICRKLAEDMFRKAFPAVSYEWPACGKDDMAEATLLAAVYDRGFVDRYMTQFRRLCP